jgi:hypothetical protein
MKIHHAPEKNNRAQALLGYALLVGAALNRNLHKASDAE